MSDLTIYSKLRSGGLSHAGACAMMGNWYCESGLISNNVENRCTLGDVDYTYAVDIGTISRYQFKLDAYGYGLAQWTYPSRKEGLYDYARSENVSISDEEMQCEYALKELHTDEYTNLYSYLCTTDNLSDATERICSDFERPAVNNYAPRKEAAHLYYEKFNNVIFPSNDAIEENDDAFEETDIVHPDNRKTFIHLEFGDGCRLRGYMPSPAIAAWQNLLLYWGYDIGKYGADGEFGADTESATKEWQKYENEHGVDIEVNGVVDEDDWLAIIEVPV